MPSHTPVMGRIYGPMARTHAGGAQEMDTTYRLVGNALHGSRHDYIQRVCMCVGTHYLNACYLRTYSNGGSNTPPEKVGENA